MPHQRCERRLYALISCSLFVAVLSASVGGLRCPTTPTPRKNKIDSIIPEHNARRVSCRERKGEKMGARTQNSKRKGSPLCSAIAWDVINVRTVSSCHAVKYNSSYRDPHRCSQLEGRQNNQHMSATLLYVRTPASLFGKDRQLDSARAEGKFWQ